MVPHALISQLVADAGGALSVAKAMNRPSFQGTLHKICAGRVASPSRDSATRIAKHFGIPVDALYDPVVAARVHAERFGGGVREAAPAPYKVRAQRERLSEGAKAIGKLYDEMTQEEQHRLRLLLWVVRPGINPAHFPPPPPDHVDEPDSGLSNLEPPAPDP